MKINKIMIVSLILLAIMTVGAVSATDELTAGETQDSLELSVDDSADIISEDDSGANEIVGQDDERLDPQITVDNLSDEDCWVDNQVWIGVHIPARATGEIRLYADGDYYDSENLWYDEDMGEWCEFLGFNYRFKHVGTTEFLIDYEGCDKYLPAQVTFEYNMENTRYNILFSNEEAYVGQERVYLDTPRGFSGDIFITVNGETYDVEREDDVEGYSYYIDSSILNYGENNVTLSTQGDDLYGEHEANRTVYLKFKAIFTETYVFGSDEPLITINLPEDANGTLSIYKEIMIWNEETFDDEYKLIFLTSDDVESGFAAISDLNLKFGYNYFVAIYEGNYGTSESRGYIYYLPNYVIPRVVVAGEEAYVSVECPEDLEGNLTVFLFPDDFDWYDYDDYKVNSTAIENGKATVGFISPYTGQQIIKVALEIPSDEMGGTFAEVSKNFYTVDEINFYFDVEFYFDNVLINSGDNSFIVDLPYYATGVINVYVDDDLIESRDADDEYFDNWFYFDATDLEYGSHNITVRYEGDDFPSSEVSHEFNVTSVLITIPENIIYNYPSDNPDEYLVGVSFNDDATGIVTVLLDNKEYKKFSIDSSEGYLRIPIKNIACGSYNVTVIYSGDEEYQGKSASGIVNISYVIYNFHNFINFADENYTMQLSTPTSIDLNKLAVTIDGKQYEDISEDKDGNIIVNVDGLSYGSHNVTINYSGDDLFPAAEFNDTINVISQIHHPPRWSEEDSGIYLILPSDAKGNLNVSISQFSEDSYSFTHIASYEIPLENGYAFCSLSDLEIGQYWIDCGYTGDDYGDITCDYEYEWDDTNFVMGPNIYWTGILNEDNDIPYGENDTLCIETPGFEGEFNIIIDRIIITGIYWDDEWYGYYYAREYVTIVNETLTLKDGKANYTLSGLELGNYRLTTTLYDDGEEIYDESISFGVMPFEINIPGDGEDDWAVSAVLPEDTIGNMTLKIYCYDEFFDEYSTSFEDGVAVIELPDLPDYDYRFSFEFTTQNYGNCSYSTYFYPGEKDYEILGEIEFNTLDTEEPVEISDNLVIATLLIPDTDEFYDAVVTVNITKNGKAFKTIKTSDLLPEYGNARGAQIYYIVLDASQLSDKDVLNITADCFEDDDVFWMYAIQKTGDYLIFNDYDDIDMEFYAFYGNLTTGDLNDPELMGPHPDGNFISIAVPDKAGVTSGTITILDEDNNVILSKALSELESEYDYSILGYSYIIALDDMDLSKIPENKTLTVTFTSGSVSLVEKRIRINDFVFLVNTAERIGRLMTVDVAKGILNGEEEDALSFRGTDELNPQSVWIDGGSGFFYVYVNGTKVENLGLLVPYEDEDEDGAELSSEIKFTKLAHHSHNTLLLNLSSLGITENGIYNIKVTHCPNEIDVNNPEEHYFYPVETLLLDKNVTVRLAGTIELADPALSIAVEDIDYGQEAVVVVSTNETFSGEVVVKIGDDEYPVNVTNGKGTIAIPALSANEEYIAIAILPETELFKADKCNDTFRVNKVGALLVVNPVELDYGSTASITVEANSTVTAKVDGNEVSVDGNVIAIPALSAGTHALSVTALGDANHIAVTQNVTFTVKPAKSGVELSSDAIAFDYGLSGSLSYTLSNATAVKAVVVDHPEANVTINGAIKVSGLNAGTYILEVTTVTDENHSAFTLSVPVTVNRLSSLLTPTPVQTTYGTSKWMYATLTSNGTPLEGKTVIFVINKVPYTATTNGDGVARVATPKTLDVKNYPVTVSLSDVNYGADSVANSLLVKKATPKVTAKAKTFRVSDRVKKYVVVVRTDKNKLYNGKVAIRVGGKTYIVKKMKDGKATFSLNKLTKKGKYLAAVKFAGDAKYNAVTIKKVKIVVK